MDLFSIIASGLILFKFFGIDQKPMVKEKTTYHPTYVHQVVDILEKEVRKEYGLNCCGSGGSMPTDIRSIRVNFETKKIATIDEVRELIVSIEERCYKIINHHENIRPFLREYPFPRERIHVSVSFGQPQGKKAKNIQNYPEFVCCIKGSIDYCQDDGSGYKYIDIFSESYDEALTAVQKSKK